MSHFYLDESKIPRVQKLLDAGLSNVEIGMRLGTGREGIRKFINKHKLGRKLVIKVEI